MTNIDCLLKELEEQSTKALTEEHGYTVYPGGNEPAEREGLMQKTKGRNAEVTSWRK